MKILHITPWYEPAWASGGTAVAASNLCRSLASAGMDVTVFTTTDSGDGRRLYQSKHSAKLGGVNVEYFPCGVGSLSFRQAALSVGLVAAICTHVSEFDLVHVHATRHIYGIAAAIACRSKKVPYVVTPHASLMSWWIEKIGNPFAKKAYIYSVDRWVTQSAAAIHYLSLLEAESSKKWAFNNNFFVIPNGVKCVPDLDTAYMRKMDGPLRLLHVGRVHPQKNTLALIQAATTFRSEQLVLDIIGAVTDEEYYQRCLGVLTDSGSQNVRFLGSLPFDEVQAAYSHYDLFCMPSLVEGVSMALIEAASYGLPSMVSDSVGNYKEIIEDGAGILTGLKAEDIRQSLAQLLKDPEQISILKRAARASAEKRYLLDVISGQMIRHYKQLLEI